jgi:SNF2-related domain/LAGLIDADG-like domain
VINPQAIEQFLKRRTADYDWLKDIKPLELEVALAELAPKPNLPNLWAHQKICFLLVEELHRFMLHIDMGGGKALPVDELVLTPRGWRKIGTLTIGESVYGANGRSTKITGVFPQGRKEIFQATFSDGATVRCCGDHLWAINTPTRIWAKKPYQVKPLKDFMGKLRDSNNWRQCFVPMAKPIEFVPSTGKTNLSAYVLGAWIGDGCRLTTSITSMDEEIISRVLEELPPNYSVRKASSDDNRAANYTFRCGKGEHVLKQELIKLGLWERYSYERFIPTDYIFGSINDRISLIQGLMDTDGYVGPDGKCYFDSSSVQLARDFAHVIRSLGGSATVSNHKENSGKGHTNVYFRLPAWIPPCFIARKHQRWANGTRRAPTRAFESVKSLGIEECVCISVEAPDGLFIANDFIVTHNTLISLSILNYRKQKGEKPKAVVFVPYVTAVETWIEETAKHTPELTCVPLVGSTAENLDALLNKEGDLFVICYQSAVAMLAEPIKAQKKKTKKKWTINPATVRQVFKGFDMLVLDEVHRCKEVSSLTYRMCRTISEQTEYTIGLTGTPFGKDLQDLWPQFNLIDFGATLGPSLGFYRDVFFNKKVNYWGGYEYKFKKPLFKKLQHIIKNVSIRYSVDEFYDMPPKEYAIKKLSPHEGIKAYADKAIEELKQGLNGDYQMVESQYLRLRQLASGFMTLKGEDSERVQVKFDENPKLDLLQELVEGLPEDTKFLCFHHFIFTNQLISERLTKLGIKHARIWGGQKDPLGELRRFKQDKNCRGLVLNWRSGSSSLNLQNASYLFVVEQPDSSIDRTQGERRAWRPGQEKRVVIYDFLMKGTMDERIHAANKAGRRLLTDLLDGKEKL